MKIFRHVNFLIDASRREPIQGIGKTEALTGKMAA
ncbi:MAG: type II toxin-antitoxin system YoeB family toxin [Boseongicola sp. SB0662_bin_57]|nr:type II toxin-antitoxin system YoeB family toxin [Boseongicola sp. SB0662_bin_57]